MCFSKKKKNRKPGPDGDFITDPYRLYNFDVFEYELDETMALYGHVPLMFGHGNNGKTAAVFWFNSAETWVDVSDDLETKVSITVVHILHNTLSIWYPNRYTM